MVQCFLTLFIPPPRCDCPVVRHSQCFLDNIPDCELQVATNLARNASGTKLRLPRERRHADDSSQSGKTECRTRERDSKA